MAKKPTIKKKYPTGGLKGQPATMTYETDPLKWNQFQGWVKQQKTPTGELYVGNPKMDTNYEGGDKIDPQTLITQWNTLNPTKKITNDDILSAQKYSGNLKADQWYGSQTSQYLYPSTGTMTDYFTSRGTTPKEGEKFNYPITIGDKKYTQFGTYTKGKPVLNEATPIFDFGGTFENASENNGILKGIKKGIQNTGEFLSNYGKGVADAGLGTIGLNNVIQDDAYNGAGANTMNTLGTTIGSVGNKVLPTVANMIVPGSSMFVQAGQQLIGSQNPEDNSYRSNVGVTNASQFKCGGMMKKMFPFGGITNVMGEDITNLTNEELTDLESRVAKLIDPKKKDDTYRTMWNLIANEKESRKIAIMNSQANPRPQQQVEVFPNGGLSGGNAEVEKEEVLQQPNGQVNQVNGPSHELGGVDVNIPDGTKIFSDRLKHPTIKKTFAKIAGKYTTDKEEEVLSNPKSNKTAKVTAQLMIDAKNKRLDQIFNEQETLKQTKVDKYATKMGLKPTINKYPYGGSKIDQLATSDGLEIQPKLRMYDEMENYTNLPYPEDQLNPARKPMLPTISNTQKDALGYTLGAIGQNLGNLSYLKDQGKRYDTQEFYNYNPELIDNKEQLRQADIESNVAAKNIASASGGNAGNYLSNRVALANQIALAKAKIMENTANLNSQIKNQGNQFNIHNKYMTDDLTARNKGQSLTNYYQALNELGQSGSGAYKDYRATQMDRDKIQMLPKIYSILEKNPELLKLISQYK